ncbi:MAG: hypothetical protein KJ970_13260 [Candidatus Eisenbacteria bacterium]|uniref:Uncharacterized protein n=1 Tax=Eiseniibacteriota bacterium TaxID=2212470 RepID=A0A948WDI3_UNCEI|nr:hypothetical protein [Candidatus Eisenbacteria bacterium]MBU1948143.1 hypothetical protein [Candidatus Eisenbacteria bacterium]MBU2691883.1 hypothetical protein [Candidatus Eisenbacteria bacterium]
MDERFNFRCVGCGREEYIGARFDAYAIELKAEIKRLKDWVADLQNGMYINCVYCGHRYGPNTDVPASMADVLKEHIEQCPDHPMSALKNRISELEQERDSRMKELKAMLNGFDESFIVGRTRGGD